MVVMAKERAAGSNSKKGAGGREFKPNDKFSKFNANYKPGPTGLVNDHIIAEVTTMESYDITSSTDINVNSALSRDKNISNKAKFNSLRVAQGGGE